MRGAVVLLALLATGCGMTKTVTVTHTVTTTRTRTVTTAIAGGYAHHVPRTAYALDLSAVDYGRLVPLDARVNTGVVLGGKPPEIVVAFARDYDEHPPYHESAVEFWRRDARAWHRIYMLRKFGIDNYLRVDKTGDVTGDGRRDVLVFQDQDGSGGCGVWRLFADAGGRLRELWVRRGCADTLAVTLTRGALVTYDAVFGSKDPKTDGYVHCCRRVWRRTSRSWRGPSPAEARTWTGPPPPPSIHHY